MSKEFEFEVFQSEWVGFRGLKDDSRSVWV